MEGPGRAFGFDGEGEVGAAEGSGEESLDWGSFRLLLFRLFGVEGVCRDCSEVREDDRSEWGEWCRDGGVLYLCGGGASSSDAYKSSIP